MPGITDLLTRGPHLELDRASSGPRHQGLRTPPSWLDHRCSRLLIPESGSTSVLNGSCFAHLSVSSLDQCNDPSRRLTFPHSHESTFWRHFWVACKHSEIPMEWRDGGMSMIILLVQQTLTTQDAGTLRESAANPDVTVCPLGRTGSDTFWFPVWKH